MIFRLWIGALAGLMVLSPAHALSLLDGGWREVRAGDTPAKVLDEYREGKLERFDPALLRHFSDLKLGSWVVLSPDPPWDNRSQVLSIRPATFRAVTVFENGHASRLSLATSGDTPAYGRLALPLDREDRASSPLLLRVEPSEAAGGPLTFQIQDAADHQRQEIRWLVFTSVCLAMMLSMVLVALCLACILRDVTYVWYAGFVLCYALVQALESGFVFQPLGWSWLGTAAEMWGTAATALSLAFASMFMVRFCKLAFHAPLLRFPIVALAVVMTQLVLMRCSQVPLLVEASQALLNPLLVLGTILLLTAAIAAGVRGSRAAWFFLAGWSPLLLLMVLRSAQANGDLVQLAWVGDASLVAGAFAAIVLSLGMAHSLLTLRHDRDVVRVLADRDALTNLLNRRAWSEQASHKLAVNPARPMAVVFLDLDHFKQLNDLRGHRHGDRALVTVARALVAELRPGDLLGRYGGEEFVALLDGTRPNEAMQVATRLCRRIHRLDVPIEPNVLMLTISAGVAMHVPGDDLERLVDKADKAMYLAKLNGRNQSVLYSPSVAGRRTLRVVETS